MMRRKDLLLPVLWVAMIPGVSVMFTGQLTGGVWTAQGNTKQMTVPELESGGGQALPTEEIRDLVLGKTLRITDLRTGEKYDVFFGEDGTRTIISAVSAVAVSGKASNSSAFEIRDAQLYTTLLDGSSFSARVYRQGNRYFGVRSDESGLVRYELLGVIEGRVTVASLLTRGAVALSTEELRALLVGKTLTIRHLVTGEIFQISYSRMGRRRVKSGSEAEDAADSTYKIQEGRLDIWENGSFMSARIYKLGNLYFGARSNEEGFVSYEILSSR